MAWLLVVLLVLLVILAAPHWPYSRRWGYVPSIVLGILLAILAILLIVSY